MSKPVVGQFPTPLAPKALVAVSAITMAESSEAQSLLVQSTSHNSSTPRGAGYRTVSALLGSVRQVGPPAPSLFEITNELLH